MQMYPGHAHTFHEAAMIHAAHNGGFPPMMHPMHHGGGMQLPPCPHSNRYRGGNNNNRHHHQQQHQHMMAQHHHHQGMMPQHHHTGGGFMPPHMMELMQQTAAKEVHANTVESITKSLTKPSQMGEQQSSEHNTSQQDPAAVSPSKVGTTTSAHGTPSATPSRHLNFSAMETTPIQQKNHVGSNPNTASAGRTMPHLHAAQQQQALMMMQQQLLASGGVQQQQPQQFTKRLERELHDGSKEDLVKLVMELCDLNSEVNNYVESKAQLFALKPAQKECASPYSYCASNGGSPISTDTAPPYTTETPMKHNGPESIVAESAGKGVTPQTPLEDLHRDLESRHCTSEDRPFSAELHPCLRLYGNCRYPTSCFYRDCPRNLCLGWLRGECTSGKECSLVHRLPTDATPQILHMMSVARGEPVTIPNVMPSSRELFNASTCSDVANVTLDEEGHAKTATPAKE